jgi:hypothetical protein
MGFRPGPLAPQECAARPMVSSAANLGGTTWEIPAPQGRGVFCILGKEVIAMTACEADTALHRNLFTSRSPFEEGENV